MQAQYSRVPENNSETPARETDNQSAEPVRLAIYVSDSQPAQASPPIVLQICITEPSDQAVVKENAAISQQSFDQEAGDLAVLVEKLTADNDKLGKQLASEGSWPKDLSQQEDSRLEDHQNAAQQAKDELLEARSAVPDQDLLLRQCIEAAACQQSLDEEVTFTKLIEFVKSSGLICVPGHDCLCLYTKECRHRFVPHKSVNMPVA